MKQLLSKNKKNKRKKFNDFCFLTFFNASEYVKNALNDMIPRLRS